MTENIKVDFRYFITSALQKKITWEALDHFLNDLTPTLATSKQVIKVLLKELQKLQSELQDFRNEGIKEEIQILDKVSSTHGLLPENIEPEIDIIEHLEGDQDQFVQDESVQEQFVQEQSDQDRSVQDRFAQDPVFVQDKFAQNQINISATQIQVRL